MSPAKSEDQLEHAVFEIATNVWSDQGETFYRSLVRQLCHVLEADFVLVGTLTGAAALNRGSDGAEKVRTLAACTPAGWLPASNTNLGYAVRGRRQQRPLFLSRRRPPSLSGRYPACRNGRGKLCWRTPARLRRQMPRLDLRYLAPASCESRARGECAADLCHGGGRRVATHRIRRISRGRRTALACLRHPHQRGHLPIRDGEADFSGLT